MNKKDELMAIILNSAVQLIQSHGVAFSEEGLKRRMLRIADELIEGAKDD